MENHRVGVKADCIKDMFLSCILKNSKKIIIIIIGGLYFIQRE